MFLLRLAISDQGLSTFVPGTSGYSDDYSVVESTAVMYSNVVLPVVALQ